MMEAIENNVKFATFKPNFNSMTPVGGGAIV